jgi:hypothetical protein
VAPDSHDAPTWKLCYFGKDVKNLMVLGKRRENLNCVVEGMMIPFLSVTDDSGVAVKCTKEQSDASVQYMVEVKKWILGDVSSLSLRY